MARSYSHLCKRAGLPAPTGFAKIEAQSSPPVRIIPSRPTPMTPHFIDHTIDTFIAVSIAKEPCGPELGRAICDMLVELKRLKS
jgi:hypothetical protein